jgi:DUF438 domain-containing protein
MDANVCISLDTGELTVEQINLILTHLPVDVTFIDEDDKIRYYSQKKKLIFPRSPEVLGQTVVNCHSPQNRHKVETILEDFHSGKYDVVESLTREDGQFIYTRNFAIRDKENKYRGCMVILENVTHIHALESEQQPADDTPNSLD